MSGGSSSGRNLVLLGGLALAAGGAYYYKHLEDPMALATAPVIKSRAPASDGKPVVANEDGSPVTSNPEQPTTDAANTANASNPSGQPATPGQPDPLAAPLSPTQPLVLADSNLEEPPPALLDDTQKPKGKKSRKPSSQEGTSEVASAPLIKGHTVSVAVGPGVSGFSATSTATSDSANFASKLSPSLFLRWAQVWSANLESFLQLKLTKVEVKAPDSKTLDGNAQTLYGAWVGAVHSLSPRWRLLGSVGIDQKLFVQSVDGTSRTMEAVTIPELSAGASFTAYQKNTFEVRLEGGGTYLLGATSATETVKSGMAGYLKLGVTEALTPAMDMEGGIFYKAESQDTSTTKRSLTEVGSALGVKFKLGQEKGL